MTLFRPGSLICQSSEPDVQAYLRALEKTSAETLKKSRPFAAAQIDMAVAARSLGTEDSPPAADSKLQQLREVVSIRTAAYQEDISIDELKSRFRDSKLWFSWFSIACLPTAISQLIYKTFAPSIKR